MRSGCCLTIAQQPSAPFELLSPPHPRQNKKIVTGWQDFLLKARPKIETVFDFLKEHLHLITSFPRSVKGYLFHYLKVLLGYQVSVI